MRQNIEDSILENCTFVGMGAPPSMFHVDFAEGELTPKELVIPRPVRVFNAWIVLQGAGVAGAKVEIYNGEEDDLLTTIDAEGTEGIYVYPSSIASEFWNYKAGSKLRLVPTGASQPAMTVYLMAHAA